jgi:hypothetical protein
LIVENTRGRATIPVLLRDIPGSGVDAISPYGYPGGSVEGEPPDPTDADWSATGLVSLFVRDRVGRPTLQGGTARSRLLLHDPARPRKMTETFSYQVRRNGRNGYTTELIPGQDVDTDTLTGFADAYRETMNRANAEARYFFPTEYLRDCLDFEQSWLTVVWTPGHEMAAGTISVISDGILHYYLGATADRHRAASPGKNGFNRLLDLSDELGTPLNLGGGLAPGDGLEAFKYGFSNTENVFVTHEVVCDAEAYAELSHSSAAHGTFFPAYRAPTPG